MSRRLREGIRARQPGALRETYPDLSNEALGEVSESEHEEPTPAEQIDDSYSAVDEAYIPSYTSEIRALDDAEDGNAAAGAGCHAMDMPMPDAHQGDEDEDDGLTPQYLVRNADEDIPIEQLLLPLLNPYDAMIISRLLEYPWLDMPGATNMLDHQPYPFLDTIHDDTVAILQDNANLQGNVIATGQGVTATPGGNMPQASPPQSSEGKNEPFSSAHCVPVKDTMAPSEMESNQKDDVGDTPQPQKSQGHQTSNLVLENEEHSSPALQPKDLAALRKMQEGKQAQLTEQKRVSHHDQVLQERFEWGKESNSSPNADKFRKVHEEGYSFLSEDAAARARCELRPDRAAYSEECFLNETYEARFPYPEAVRTTLYEDRDSKEKWSHRLIEHQMATENIGNSEPPASDQTEGFLTTLSSLGDMITGCELPGGSIEESRLDFTTAAGSNAQGPGFKPNASFDQPASTQDTNITSTSGSQVSMVTQGALMSSINVRSPGAVPTRPGPPSTTDARAASQPEKEDRGRPGKRQGQEETSLPQIPSTVPRNDPQKRARLSKQGIASGPHTFQIPKHAVLPEQQSYFDRAHWSAQDDQNHPWAIGEEDKDRLRSRFPDGTDYGFFDAELDQDGNLVFPEDADTRGVTLTSEAPASETRERQYEGNSAAPPTRDQQGDLTDISAGGFSVGVRETGPNKQQDESADLLPYDDEEHKEILEVLIYDLWKLSRQQRAANKAKQQERERWLSALKDRKDPVWGRWYRDDGEKLQAIRPKLALNDGDIESTHLSSPPLAAIKHSKPSSTPDPDIQQSDVQLYGAQHNGLHNLSSANTLITDLQPPGNPAIQGRAPLSSGQGNSQTEELD